MSNLEYQVILDATIDEVWHTWTDSKDITNWFSPEAYIEPKQGGAYELYFDPSNHDHMSTKGCKITEITPKTRLSFQWRGPDRHTPVMNNPDPQTHVHVTFKQQDNQTTVNITHTGWGTSEPWNQARQWHDQAWKGVIDALQNHFNKKNNP